MMVDDPTRKVLKPEEWQQLFIILDILRSVEPAPMDFRNFFPDPADLAQSESSGIVQLLLYAEKIKKTEKPNHYAITEKGLFFINRIPDSSIKKVYPQKDETDNLVVSIQPSSWPHRQEALWLPMMNDFGRLKNDLPVITFGYNRPDVVEKIPSTEKNKNLIPQLLELAISNLKSIKLNIREELESGIVFITGDYFASEKILDQEFMLSYHQKLKSDTLIASIPKKGYLFITRDFSSLDQMNTFKLITKMEYEREAPQIPLSLTLFVIVEGKIWGIVGPEF